MRKHADKRESPASPHQCRTATGRCILKRIPMSKWLLSALLAINVLGQTPAADTAAGKKIFESQCALCHGQTGTGGRGPSLNRAKLAKAPDDEALWKVITH